MNHQSKNKSGPRSHNTTSDCSSTVDDSRQLIDTARTTANFQQEQILNAEHLQLAPYFPAPNFVEYPPPGAGMFFDPNCPPGFFPPPPMMMPPYMQPPPPGPPFFAPQKPPGLDFEMFTYRRGKKSSKKRQKRRSRSLEFIGPDPSMNMQPNPFAPPPPMPPFFGCPPPPMMPFGPPQMQNYGMFPPPGPMLALEGPTGAMMKPDIDYSCNQNPHPADPYIQPFPFQPEGFIEPQPQANMIVLDYEGNTMMKKGGFPGEFVPNENDRKGIKEKDAEKQKPQQQIDLKTCCKGFSQILWLILSIVLVGLILGLVLGLTLV